MSNAIQLNVNEPCHENWDKMTPVEQGRFCQSCQTTVTDFSLMSDKEILDHLANREAKVCGRFTEDQLNRQMTADIPKRFSFSYAWNLLLAGLLTAGTAEGQVKVNKPVKQKEQLKPLKKPGEILMGAVAYVQPSLNVIKGRVVDSQTQEPIPGASVQFEQSLSGVSADTMGLFSLPLESDGRYVIVKVSAVGYAPQEIKVNSDTSGIISVYLDKAITNLDTVVVINKVNCNLLSVVAGGLSVSRHISYVEKTTRKIDSWKPDFFRKKEVSVYPNPVNPGMAVTVSLALKTAGNYQMEILDERGQVVYRQQLHLESNTQNIQVMTNGSWSRGVYWVRLTQAGTTKVVNGKMVVI